MTNSYLLYAIFAMALVTFVTRALPALIPTATLDRPWLHRLNERLPLSVLVLLILTSLAYQGLLTPLLISKGMTGVTAEKLEQLQLFIAQIVALVVVLLSYHFSRQLLLSMIAGIAVLNAVLWLLS